MGQHRRDEPQPDDTTQSEDAKREASLESAVATAEHALIEFEIAVETFRVEVDNFARLHHQRLGPMYTRLDELDALIAEAVAARTGDPDDIRRAEEARSVVQPMPDVDELFGRPSAPPEADPEPEPEPPRRVRPSKEAQRLYRELARQAHPDLAQDPAEQERRGAFIARVNEAYAQGDEEQLVALANEWAAGPVEPHPLHGIEVLYARLEWLAARQEALTALRTELEESAIGAMLRMAPDDPDALLNDIAEQLLTQVTEREKQLAELLHPEPDQATPPPGRPAPEPNPHGRDQPMFNAPPTVDPAQVPADSYVLDVREPDEWQAGHVEGAVHIPMGEIPSRVSEVPKDRTVHVVCRVGGRSAQVTRYLVAQGWDAVNIDGGMLAWASAGRPMVADHGGPAGVL